MSSFNQSLFKLIYYRIPHVEVLNILAIFFAKYLPYLLVLAFLVLVLYQKGWRCKLYLFCEGALAVILSLGLIAEIIKFFYHHPRPFSFYNFTPLISEGGWSFPSSHATLFFTLAMTIWCISKKWGITFFVLATIMGVARVYTGVHWPLDIIGGAVIGIASAIGVHALLKNTREQLKP